MIAHSIEACKLAALLRQLQPNDLLVPNSVRNLAIYRNGEYIGFIDLLEDCQSVVFF